MEPIYGVEDTTTSFVLSRFFSLKNKSLLHNLRYVLETIRDAQNEMCTPLPSMPGQYTFATNISCDKLVQTLTLYGYTVNHIVINFSQKAIGVLAQIGSNSGYVPCFPSSTIPGFSLIYMDSDELWKGYTDTVKFLNDVYKRTKSKVPCRPQLRVIEKGLVVGILTETNQFIQLSEPEEPVASSLPILEGSNYVIADEIVSVATTADVKRETSMKKIRLESEFYDAFRNTVRIILNKYQNSSLRERIESVISSPITLYLDKLDSVQKMLRELCKSEIVFKEYTTKTLDNISNVHACIMADSEKCASLPYCVMGAEKCKLQVPASNLIGRGRNEVAYYGKMADELIRYTRIKAFVFEPKAFLAFGQVGYQLRPDEVILLQSLLGNDYFEDLVPAITNKYVTSTSYDNAQPITSVPYSNLYEPKDSVEPESKVCAHVKRVMLSRKWKSQFPVDSVGLVFDTSPPSCTFDTMLTMIQDSDRTNSVTVATLKEYLGKPLRRYSGE